jgi:hypothetical protein
MTLDPEHHRAFLSCEENNLMTVFDLDKHEPIGFLPMAEGPDVIKSDPGLGRILCRMLRRSDFGIPSGRPRSLPETRRLQGATCRAQLGSRPGDASRVHPGAGGERQACRPDGSVWSRDRPIERRKSSQLALFASMQP